MFYKDAIQPKSEAIRAAMMLSRQKKMRHSIEKSLYLDEGMIRENRDEMYVEQDSSKKSFRRTIL